MIILEQIMEIKILDKHGKSLRTIAGEVGVFFTTEDSWCIKGRYIRISEQNINVYVP